MILSFNPVIPADVNLICAGRPPGKEEVEAVSAARAVILSQGVREDLYRLCRSICPLVWPNQDIRFDYPGKMGQAILFAARGLDHPATVVLPSVLDYEKAGSLRPCFPLVLKTNLGGEGSGVFFVEGTRDEEAALRELRELERIGRGGFVLQELVFHGGRDLRVVKIGTEYVAYWRLARTRDGFLNNLAAGGQMDFDSDPNLIRLGTEAVEDFAVGSGIDLAAFDIMFDKRSPAPKPLFIEINHYFGRHGLGGSEAFYERLGRAALAWLAGHGLKPGPPRTRPNYSQRD